MFVLHSAVTWGCLTLTQGRRKRWALLRRPLLVHSLENISTGQILGPCSTLSLWLSNNDGQIVHANVALIFPNLLMTILYILYYTDYIKWVMTLTQRMSIPSCWCQKAAGKLFFSWLTKTQKQHMEYDKTLGVCTSLVHFTRVQRDIALYSSACNVISWGSARLILLLVVLCLSLIPF